MNLWYSCISSIRSSPQMDPGQGKEKCACEMADSLESDSSNSEPQPVSKEKRSKINLFNLRRARALHFNSKRSKKAAQTQGTSSNCKYKPNFLERCLLFYWAYVLFNCETRNYFLYLSVDDFIDDKFIIVLSKYC